MSNREGRAISFPFSIDSSGSVSYITNDAKIWEDRVRCVLLTYFSERVMRPDFGSKLAALSFESNWGMTSLAEKITASAFNKWLPELKLTNVVALPDDVNGGIVVNIDYTLPDGSVGNSTLTQRTETLNRYGEIVLGE